MRGSVGVLAYSLVLAFSVSPLVAAVACRAQTGESLLAGEAYNSQRCEQVFGAFFRLYAASKVAEALTATNELETNCGGLISNDQIGIALQNSATALLKAGQLREAQRLAERCYDRSQNPWCLLLLGDVQHAAGRIENAIGAWREGLRAVRQKIDGLNSMIARAPTSEQRNDYVELKRVGLKEIDNYERRIRDAHAAKEPSPETPQDSTGTGIIINTGGDIITNFHVVNDCKAISVRLPSGQEKATPQAVDHKLDLAVIKVGGPLRTAATFRDRAGEAGEAIVAMGYPLVGLLSNNGVVSFGHISALTGLSQDQSKLQISAPVQPGNSGGPVFDQTGLVVGIVVEKLNAIRLAEATGDIPQNINFAIKGEVAQAFLETNGIAFTRSKPHRALDNTEITRQGWATTVLVTCFK